MQEQQLVRREERDSREKESVALIALEQQEQICRLKEWLILIGMVAGAVALRKIMEPLPSAEPITFFAVLAGWLFGRRKGAGVGIAALLLSNMIMVGGHGIWTLFQAIGFGLAGWIGGLLPQRARWWHAALAMLAATLAFEIIINATSFLYFPMAFGTTLLVALPFMVAHLVSNLGFAAVLPYGKRLVEKGAGLSHRKTARLLLARLRGRLRR
ncbi:hypothetical protein JXB02_04285 [Candidatus Woesearchaeota archaeon]|nr:hypothetical protein [Candidatus Woesearchaeota archaeon]